MDGKNTGAVLATIFFIVVCALIGSTFMAFVYEDKKVVVNNPSIISGAEISVTDEKGNALSSLTLSKTTLGLKPATGEEDAETNIPFTITDTVGTEGQYAKFFVKSDVNFNIFVKNINIESKENTAQERKHICVGIKNEKETTKTLEEDNILLYSGVANTEPKELTFFVWLHAHASNILAGAKISFDLEFVAV